MHRLAEVKIENFRSCAVATLTLDDFTPIVGYNNSGKSNLMAAIKWAVRATSLGRHDYLDPEQPVVVTFEIADIGPELLHRLDSAMKTKIEPFLKNGSLILRRTQRSPGLTLKAIELEVLGKDNEWKPNPGGIDNSLKHLFPEPIEIGAMEDATEDVSTSKSSTTIGKLIAEIVTPLEQSHGEMLASALQEVRESLGAEGLARAPELVEMDRGTNERLAELFPGLTVRIHVPPPELREMLKSGTIKVLEPGSSVYRDADNLGHGAQRSIQMALVQFLADLNRVDAESTARTLLLIDEPELYLHPHGIEQVQQALRRLSQREYQVIFATHSPLMICGESVAAANIVTKRAGGFTEVRPRVREVVRSVVADSPSQAEALFELSNLSQVLFSDVLVLTEGKTERRLLPYLFESLKGRALGASRIGLVVVDGATSIARSVGILGAMGVECKALADLDFAFRAAVSAGLVGKDEEALVAARRICGEKADALGFHIADDGFPARKTDGLSASEAFAELARLGQFAEIVGDLHARLLRSGIWIWRRGSIEHHLGITGKSLAAHLEFRDKLARLGAEAAVRDFGEMKAAIEWLETPLR